MHAARVVTYNVLSDRLASAEHFTACDPANLKSTTRLERIKAKLEEECGKNSVICLQEVSAKWAGEFHVFFARLGYSFVVSNYGNPFNGYMGVGVAYPLALYEVNGVDLTRVADTKKNAWPKDPSEKKPSDFQKRVIRVLDGFKKVFGVEAPKKTGYKGSATKFNTMVTLTLKDKVDGVEFCVANYHMPCAFYDPPLMGMHVAMAVQYAQRLAQQRPLALAGDWNIKPDAGTYAFITSGDAGQLADATPTVPEYDTWTVSDDFRAMRSAYAVKCGSEPDFTNWAIIRDGPPFIETLDYIFISENVEVEEVDELPHRSDVDDNPFPSATEPSDHIMIGARLKFLGARR